MTTLRARLLRSWFATAVPPVLAIAVIGTFVALRQVHRNLTDRLLAGARGSELALATAQDGIQARAQAAARSPQLQQALRATDRLAVLGFAEAALGLLGVDRVRVTNGDGRVVARGHSPARYGDAMTGGQRLDAETSALGRGEAGLAILVSVPIRTPTDELIGLLSVERTIDHVLLSGLSQELGLDYSVWDGERLQATTLRSWRALEEAERARREQAGGGEIFEGELDHFARVRLAAGAGSGALPPVLVSMSVDSAAQLARRLEWLNLLVALGMVVLTTVGAVLSARRIVEPIGRLMRATEEATRGHLDVPIDVERDDEIGQLATRFRRLLERRQQVEQELRDTQADLERRVEVRTEALRQSEEQLRQARQIDALGRLAGGVAHDFNNMLTVILGNIAFAEARLAGQGGQRDLREAVEEVKTSAEHAAALTRQLLMFSRKQVLQPGVLDLGRAVRDVERMLRRLVAEDVLLEIEIAEDLAPLCADANQLGQILVNLVLNAADALPQGGRIHVSAANAQLAPEAPPPAPGMAPGAYVVLAVRDSGSGMDAVTLERVFEPFFTTKAPGQGTGMGLSIVHGIVRQSGAHIAVASARGEGTTFRIFFPALAPDAAAALASMPVSAPAPASSAAAATPSARRETLLVCEDQASVRKFIAGVLSADGYRVLVAETGEQALALAAAHPEIALLISDVVMPGLNGAVLARSLRARAPGLHVLYVSGYTADVLDARADLGPTDVLLEKPFTREALLARVRAMLGP